jgi:hypothetical protein
VAVSLKRALMEILTDWPDDLTREWRDACSEEELGFGHADPEFELESWEPAFPVRRGRRADAVIAQNTFVPSNQRPEAMGAKPIAW